MFIFQVKQMDENFDLLSLAPVSFVGGPSKCSHSDNGYTVISSDCTLVIITSDSDDLTKSLSLLWYLY